MTSLPVVRQICICVLGVACFQQVFAESLPSWSPKERELVEKGLLIPGADLLVEGVDFSQPLSEDRPPAFQLRTLPDEPVYDPEPIPERFLSTYFREGSEQYLNDAQKLLSQQEANDIQGFLAYHAEESEIDIQLYLFDAKQIVPDEYNLEKLAQERYGKSELTAVVFCFLGDPSRNRLAFGGKGVDKLQALEQRRILENSLLRAMEKSEVGAQVEAFAVELSIKLYWLEQESHTTEGEEVAKISNETSMVAARAGALQVQSFTLMDMVTSYWLYLLVGLSSVLLVILGTGSMLTLWKKKCRYHFQVLEMPRRLGADYAAGVGAIMAFHNKYGSPANQREDGPDYLTNSQ